MAARRLALAGLIVAMGLVACTLPTVDPDVWWHLAVGRAIVATRSLLPVETWSFRYAGEPWRYKDVLADLLLWGAFRGASFGGLFAAKLVAVGLIALGLSLGAPPDRRRAVPLIAALTLVLLGLVHLTERPSLASFGLLPLQLALLDRARRRAVAPDLRALAGAFAPVLAVQQAWVWLHRGALLGFVLIAGGALALLASHLLAARPRARILLGPPPSRAGAIAGIVVAVVAPLLGLANPCGLAFYRTGFGVARSAMLRQHIAEWRPVELAGFGWSYVGLVVAFALCAAAARIVIALRRGRPGPLDLLHAGALALLVERAFDDSVRWVPLAGLVAAYVVHLLLAEAWARATERAGGRMPRGSAVLAGALALAALELNRSEPYRLGGSGMPRAALGFAAQQKLGGRCANAYGLGGYLIYHLAELAPGAGVLVDGRNDLVYPPDFVARAIRSQTDPAEFDALRADDRADWVLAWNTPSHASHRFLAGDPRWALVYWSDVATVYVRRDAHPDLARHALHLSDPVALDVAVIDLARRSGSDAAPLDALDAELQEMIAASPDSARPRAGRVILLHLRGPAFHARRDEALRELAARHPELAARLQAQLAF